jgi:F-type H+-transporting ATPase subunit gamma
MPSLKTIRKRITSVKSTQKITRALKMVAGARLNRAQQRIVSLRPYAVKTADVLHSIASTVAAEEAESGSVGTPLHPLLERREEKKVLFLVLSADRGLCGAFNTNITKATYREWKAKEAQGAQVVFATGGRKAREFLQRRGATIAQDFPHIFDQLDLTKARVVSEWIVSNFLKKEFDAVYLVFNEFKSAITQKVNLEPLLPLKAQPPPAVDNSPNAYAPEFLYEPSRHALLQKLVPMYVEITIYRGLLESQASFFGAQMTAMDAATRNAKDMIGRLTLVYNRARQAAITKELMEIIGGAEALKD